VCSSTGEGFIHSMEEGILKDEIHPRLEESESHISHTNRRTEINEIRDPKEETVFHMVNASG
jgi:hypothetical protein